MKMNMKQIKPKVKMNTQHLIALAAAALLLICISTGAAAAADNATINATNSSASNIIAYQPEETTEPVTPLFINTDEYAEQYDYWYNYYQSLTPSDAEQRQQITAYLTDSTANEETRFNNILSYIGRTESLITFMDESKRTIDEYTGEITYNLGFFNGIANLFGGGVNESDLPLNIAQGNALFDVYMERYVLYLTVEWGLVHGNAE